MGDICRDALMSFRKRCKGEQRFTLIRKRTYRLRSYKISEAFQYEIGMIHTGGDKAMIEINTIKHRRTKMGKEASCWYSLLSFKGIRSPFISLIITLLIFGL